MKTNLMIGMMMVAEMQLQAKDCNVDVYVVTVVSKPVGILVSAAKPRVTAMFHGIGVNIHMRNGMPAPDADRQCGAPIIVQVEDASNYPVPASALAYALPYQKTGTCIHLFLDRIARRSDQPSFLTALLAHVMAHEITHVLEQIVRHSDEGLMKANWSGQDFRQMERTSLHFAALDAELIRDGLAKRSPHAAE